MKSNDTIDGRIIAQPSVRVGDATSVRVYWSRSKDWGVVRITEAARYVGRYVRIREGWLWE